MSKTDNTRPFWVRDADKTMKFWKYWGCGRGCSYCGMGRARKKHENHRTRNAANRHLREEGWRKEYD